MKRIAALGSAAAALLFSVPCTATSNFVAIAEAGDDFVLLAITRTGEVWRGTFDECDWQYCTTIPVTSGAFVGIVSGDHNRRRTVALTDTGELWTCDDCDLRCGTGWQLCGRLQEPTGARFVGLASVSPYEQRLAAITENGAVWRGSLCAPTDRCAIGGATAADPSTWGQIKHRAGQ